MTRSPRALGALLAVLAGLVYYLSPVHTSADSHYSLLLSDALLRTGSPDLSAAFRDPAVVRTYPGYERRFDRPYQVEWVGDRVRYKYPPASSVLSIPGVAVLAACGVRPVTAAGHYDAAAHEFMERVLAAALTAGTVWWLFLVTARLAGAGPGVVITGALAFGSSLWTIAGNAMWSHTWAVFLLGGSIVLLVRPGVGPDRAGAILAGLACASMCAVRPTLAPSAVALLGYVWISRFATRRVFTLSLLAAGAGWVLVHEALGMPLIAGQHRGQFSFQPAWMTMLLLLHTVSPSRGLLVTAPVTLCILWLVIRHARASARDPLLWTAVFAVAAHFGVLALWSRIGGYCFGSRLTTDILPWVAVAGGLGWAAAARAAARVGLPDRVAAILLVTVGVALHGVGACNPLTLNWITYPDSADVLVDRHFRWSYPQWLAGVAPVPPTRWAPRCEGELVIRADDPATARFFGRGWGGPEGDVRWTGERRVESFFNLVEVTDVTLEIHARPFLVPPVLATQTLHLVVNGRRVESRALSSLSFSALTFRLPAHRLGKLNTLTLELPDATPPDELVGDGDVRHLGLLVREIRFYPDAENRKKTP